MLQATLFDLWDESISSAEGHPVSRSPARASDSDRQTHGGCGRKCCVSCGACDPDGSCLRTLLLSGLSGWTGYSLNWKRQVTPAGRSWWVLVLSDLRREVEESTTEVASGCGSSVGWPTPTRGDGAQSGAAGYSTESGRHPGTTLTDAVVRGWGTPRKGNGGFGRDRGENRGRLEDQVHEPGWPTPAARGWRDGRASPETMDRNARPLNEVVVTGWPTPTASDGKGPNPSKGNLDLPTAVAGQPGEASISTHGSPRAQHLLRKWHKRRLSSRWTLTLMGFPSTWLDGVGEFDDSKPPPRRGTRPSGTR